MRRRTLLVALGSTLSGVLIWRVLFVRENPDVVAVLELGEEFRRAWDAQDIDAIAALFPEDKRKKAQQKVDYYIRRWGEDDNNDARISSGKCTGSRLACNFSPPSHNWISWKRNEPQEQELKDRIETLNQSIMDSAGG